MDKKLIGFLLIGVAGGFLVGWFTYPLFLAAPTTPTTPNTILYGTGSRPRDLDPAYAWDSASADVIDQVFEGLFRYDLNSPICPIEPWLAVDFGSWNGLKTELTLNLRQGVKFHDGWDFNATAVKFTFDRLNFLCNATGERDANNLTQIAELYTFNSTDILYTNHFNNQTVINHVEILGTYSVKFVLNCSYPAFMPLLCFSGSYIVSPNPSSTPFDDFMTLSTSAKIYGTGPYIYDQYITNAEVRFHRNDAWWVNPVVKPVQYLKFIINADAASRNNATYPLFPSRQPHSNSSPIPGQAEQIP